MVRTSRITFPTSNYNEHKIATLYFDEIKKYPLLTAKQERRYLNLAQKGSKKAKQLMIASNLRLVINISMSYISTKYSLMDVISEGNLGLFKAIEKFNTSLGYRFSTYATWWIKQSIEKSLTDKSRTIRIPHHVLNQIYKLKKIQNNFKKTKNRNPKLSELSNILRQNENKTATQLEITSQINSLENQSYNTFSDESNIPSSDSYSPYNILHHYEKKQYLTKLLETLSDIEKEVICHRYGLLGYPPSTLKYISIHVGKTIERVRQIQIETIIKLNRLIKSSGKPT